MVHHHHDRVVLVLFLSWLSGVTIAMRSQQDFPACAVNHAPQYYCCVYGTQKELFTRFQRPRGDAFDEVYAEGWAKARQVNFPEAFYTPDSPSFVYTDPQTVCRVQRVYSPETDSIRETLACGPKTTIHNTFGGTVVTNASLPDNSRDASVFWTSRTSLRNDNASFIIGATCTSLMRPDGRVDVVAKARCVPPKTAPSFRFKTYKEAPLVVVYVAYGLLVVLLLLWIPLRASLSMLRRAGSFNVDDSTSGPALLSKPSAAAQFMGRVPGPMKEPNARFVDETTPSHTVLAVPMLTRRNTDAELLRLASDAIEQTGYRDSMIGHTILVYLIVLTIGLLPLMVIVILDNNHHFSPPLFDPQNVLVVVYMLVWMISAVWLALIVATYDKLTNVFRIREPLDRCQYVALFNPEVDEIGLHDRSGVSQCMAKLESILFPRSRRGFAATQRVETTADGHRFVEFQHLRYVYDEMVGRFVPGSIPVPETFAHVLDHMNGLTSRDVQRRHATVGDNAIRVPLPSVASSIAYEIGHLFYVYEFLCYSVWFFQGNYQVAVANAGIIIAVLTFNTIAKRRILASVLHLTRVQGGVAVQRDGVWQTIPVRQLIPGDLVRVVENWDVPCDLVLVRGRALCDESALTGESVPVQKFPVPTQSHEPYDPQDLTGKKHTLFAGSRTLASGRESTAHDDLLAVVTATGALTARGRLIQSILYPALVRFKYDEHLKACIVFLFVYGVIAAYIAMRLLMDNAGLSNTLFAFIFGVYMLSAVLSPLIPVVLTLGQYNASRRLQERGVYCLNATRVPLCGKVRVFAFDKTGTITKEGLDLRGVLPIATAAATRTFARTSVFAPECDDVTHSNVGEIFQFALATCHALGYLDDELVGNQVELKMLEATQWRLVEERVIDGDQERLRTVVESSDGAHTLEILRRFEFDHGRATMAVVVQDLMTHRRFVFCKGSYEKLEALCDPHSLPADYTQRAERLARDGCYVLGVGFKELPKGAISLQLDPFLSTSYGSARHSDDADVADPALDVHAMSRDDVEQNLALLGLILFQNELKEDSADVLAKLQAGDVRVVMITGDNAMTGCYIARMSSMIRPGARVVLGDILIVNTSGARALVWKDVDTMETVTNREVHDMAEGVGSERWELAITGAAFTYLRKMGELPTLLFHIRIFSRMSPTEKAECITEMMAAGAVTGMCGDGGNDCGALRIAHVGVALSDTEASVVSPFTSQRKSIVSVLDVVREGRCTLTTAFGNLKFLMMYGLIGCGLRFCMYANAVFISQVDFMFCDGLILVGLSYAISLAKPLRTLGTHRPTSSLVGATTIISIAGQLLIHITFLYVSLAMLVNAPWYCPFNPTDVDLTKWWLLQDSHMGGVLFVIIATQYISTALAYGFGSKYHEPVHKNYVLVAYTTFLLGSLLYLTVGPPSVITEFLRMPTSTNVVGLPEIPMPSSFCWRLVFLAAGNLITIVVYERVFVLGPVKHFFRRRFHRDHLPLRQ